MTKLIAFTKLLVLLYPILAEIIQAIEAQFPQAGLGAQKARMLKVTLEAAFASASDVAVSFEESWPKIKAMADAMVALYNVSGSFKKPA